MKVTRKRVANKFMQMETGIVVIIISNMDSLSITWNTIRSTFQNNQKCRLPAQREICWRVKEQLDFVTGALHNAIFCSDSIPKREEKTRRVKSASRKKLADGRDLHSHTIYLSEGNIFFRF